MVFDEAPIAEARKCPDFKKSFELGCEDNERTPIIWFDYHILPGFRALMLQYFETCYGTAMNLLKAIALGMGLPENFFHECHTKKRQSVATPVLFYLSRPSYRDMVTWSASPPTGTLAQ
jgi:isopenicillin N synthase-like dioxygenase